MIADPSPGWRADSLLRLLEALTLRQAEHQSNLDRVTAARRETILAALDAGASVADTARAAGISRQRVHQIQHDGGTQ